MQGNSEVGLCHWKIGFEAQGFAEIGKVVFGPHKIEFAPIDKRAVVIGVEGDGVS